MSQIIREAVNGLFTGIETALAWGSSYLLKSDIASYCHLVTVQDENTLVTRDASLLTIIEYSGAIGMVGPVEYENIVESLARALTPYFSRTGHSLQWMFERDPDATIGEIKERMRPSRETATRMGLDCQDILDDRCNVLAKCTAKERAYICLYTHYTALGKDDAKMESTARMAKIAKTKIPTMEDAQKPTLIVNELVSRHHAFVDSILEDLRITGLHASVLKASEATREIKSLYEPETTPDNWRPLLPGDKFIPRTSNARRDASELFYPSLTSQICSKSAVIKDLDVKIGLRHYRGAVMEEGPQTLFGFMQLFQRMPQDLPWRVTFDIRPEILNQQKFKDIMLSLAGWADSNKYTKSSLDALKEYQLAGACIVGMQVTALTWAESPSNAERRLSLLVNGLQGWGPSRFAEEAGDPMTMLAQSIPGFTMNSTGSAQMPPIDHCVSMLPFQRPASPWYDGSLILRTPDGKLYPYQPGSSVQDTWNILIYAPPGSGKSVLLNALNLAMCMSPGIGKLPLITVVDIGPSSQGLISLIRASLPPERQHEAGYFKIRMSKEFTINPFDTQLGFRYPTSPERAFLVGLITLFATPLGKTVPIESSSDLAGMMIDEVYKLFDKTIPRNYEQHVDQEVDELIEAHGITLDEATTWWEITDALFKKGELHGATLAQRQAVPRLSDLMSVIKSSVIRDTFQRSDTSCVRISTGETLLDAMSRIISSAEREFPIFTGCTKFDLGDVRVASIDLREIGLSGGDAGKRALSIMYLVSRQLAVRSYYLEKEMLEGIAPMYADYHLPRIKEIQGDMKTIAYDEFHNTGGMTALRDVILMDMRQGRKSNVQIAIASQYLTDFMDEDNAMVNSATAVFIMNSGNEQMVTQAKEMFGLSDTAISRLKRDVHGAGPHGANMLAWLRTKKGTVVQILNNRCGGIELWAFSTTSEDVALRTRMYELTTQKHARAILAERFPRGSAKSIIEEMKVTGAGNEDDENNTQAIIDRLAKELIANAAKQG